MKPLNPDKKCLSCHCNLEDKYYFCSFACGCIAGYYHVRADDESKSMEELKDKRIRENF